MFKLVVGDYGSGKSHFLYCVRDRAWQRNFAVSKVDLSPKESPYDDQRRVYAAVTSSIIWHELGDLGEDERGLTRFLEGTLRRIVHPHGVDLEDPGAAEVPEVRALLQTLESTPVDSLSFHKAVQGFFTALLRGQDRRVESLERWLHGEEVTPEDMRDLRSIDILLNQVAADQRSTRITPSRCCGRCARWCAPWATRGWACCSTKATAC